MSEVTRICDRHPSPLHPRSSAFGQSTDQYSPEISIGESHSMVRALSSSRPGNPGFSSEAIGRPLSQSRVPRSPPPLAPLQDTKFFQSPSCAQALRTSSAGIRQTSAPPTKSLYAEPVFDPSSAAAGFFRTISVQQNTATSATCGKTSLTRLESLRWAANTDLSKERENNERDKSLDERDKAPSRTPSATSSLNLLRRRSSTSMAISEPATIPRAQQRRKSLSALSEKIAEAAQLAFESTPTETPSPLRRPSTTSKRQPSHCGKKLEDAFALEGYISSVSARLQEATSARLHTADILSKARRSATVIGQKAQDQSKVEDYVKRLDQGLFSKEKVAEALMERAQKNAEKREHTLETVRKMQDQREVEALQKLVEHDQKKEEAVKQRNLRRIAERKTPKVKTLLVAIMAASRIKMMFDELNGRREEIIHRRLMQTKATQVQKFWRNRHWKNNFNMKIKAKKCLGQRIWYAVMMFRIQKKHRAASMIRRYLADQRRIEGFVKAVRSFRYKILRCQRACRLLLRRRRWRLGEMMQQYKEMRELYLNQEQEDSQTEAAEKQRKMEKQGGGSNHRNNLQRQPSGLSKKARIVVPESLAGISFVNVPESDHSFVKGQLEQVLGVKWRDLREELKKWEVHHKDWEDNIKGHFEVEARAKEMLMTQDEKRVYQNATRASQLLASFLHAAYTWESWIKQTIMERETGSYFRKFGPPQPTLNYKLTMKDLAPIFLKGWNYVVHEGGVVSERTPSVERLESDSIALRLGSTNGLAAGKKGAKQQRRKSTAGASEDHPVKSSSGKPKRRASIAC